MHFIKYLCQNTYYYLYTDKLRRMYIITEPDKIFKDKFDERIEINRCSNHVDGAFKL